jgi:hypothetical protein
VQLDLGYGDSKEGRDIIAHYLTNVIYKIKTEPLDPAYVWEYAWPKGATFITTQGLYEQFHQLPDLIAPATIELFQSTLKQGVEEGQWEIKQGETLFTTKNIPKVIRVDNNTEILTKEEAESRGLHEGPVEEPGTPTSTPGVKTPVQRPLSSSTTFTVGPSKPDTLAEGIEKKSKRDSYPYVDKINLSISGHLNNILQVKNLMTRLAPEKTIKMNFRGTIRRSAAPQYSIHFNMVKEDIQKDEGRQILEQSWRIKGAETCDLYLEVNWPKGTTAEKAGNLIRSLDEGATEPFIARMEAHLSRQL